ncbi:hypothetical protein LXL04_034076 [Taraxacum kok-saghyz]
MLTNSYFGINDILLKALAKPIWFPTLSEFKNSTGYNHFYHLFLHQNYNQRDDIRRLESTICARVPRLTTGKTCLKSPPKTIIFPPNGCITPVISCIVRLNASIACRFAIDASSHMIILALRKASLFQFLNALRRLFATTLVFCDPGDVRKLWTDHYNALSEDYRRDVTNDERVQNMVLKDIELFLQSMGNNLSEFDLPVVNTDVDLQSFVFREVQEESLIVVETDHLRAQDFLNTEQKYAYDEIMTHVRSNCAGVLFINGPGGTRKTYLYKALLSNIRKCGHIALATASSGVAANNMPGARTDHSRFKIPLNLDNNSICNIKKQSGVAQLLQSAKIIIWDEASMAKRQAIEAFNQTMQDITVVMQPFDGTIMVLGGDFRQVLPVVRRGTRAQIIDSSLRMSHL